MEHEPTSWSADEKEMRPTLSNSDGSRPTSRSRDLAARPSRGASWSRPVGWVGRSISLSSPEPDFDPERQLEQVPSHATHESHQIAEENPAEAVSDESGDDSGRGVAKTVTQDSKAPGGVLHPDSFPDGGLKAWMAVMGGFCCLFVSFGWINAIGIFQEVYQTTILSSYSPSTVAWIVSLETFCMFFGGPFMGLLFDNFGPRPLLLVGTFLHVFGLMMASISTKYWHFILSQGLCSPIGASALFYAALSSVVTWFHRRRGLALGVMASGSSLGGVIFPIMVQKLIPKVGFPWSMRIAAFMILGLLFIANLTVRSRLEPKKRRFDALAFVRPLVQPTFALLTIASFCIFFGLFIPFTFLPLQALQTGMDPTLDLYIIPILNAASIFGRITPGYVSDKVGRFNTTIAMCGLCGVLVLALWLPATAPAPVVVFAALYGFGSGAFVSIVPALVATVSPDMRHIGTRNGTLFAVISIAALCGNPIAGVLIGKDDGHYNKLKIFCGCFICGGTILMAALRAVLSKGRLAVKI